jgi:protein-S-isoprenylcysteine O-methyltransferase Ste14
VVYVTCFVWLFAWLALSVRRFDAGFAVVWPEAIGPVAVVLMAVGVALAFTCVGVFVARGRGTPALFDPPREFVAIGPYRCVRNPMYVGGLTLLVGFGVWHAGWLRRVARNA